MQDVEDHAQVMGLSAQFLLLVFRHPRGQKIVKPARKSPTSACWGQGQWHQPCSVLDEAYAVAVEPVERWRCLPSSAGRAPKLPPRGSRQGASQAFAQAVTLSEPLAKQPDLVQISIGSVNERVEQRQCQFFSTDTISQA
jgi:hypothetical protein